MGIISTIREKLIPPRKQPSVWDSLVRWLLLGTVFLMPVFFLNPTSYPLELNKTIVFNILILLATVIFFLKALFRRELVLVRTRLDWPLAGLAVFTLISFIFSRNHYLSLVGVSGYYSAGLVSVICFILFFYLIVQTIKKIQDVWWFLGALLSSVVLVIVYNYFQLNNLFLLPWTVTKNTSFNLVANSATTLALVAATGLILALGIFLYSTKRWVKIAGGAVVLASLGLLFLLYRNVALYTLAIGLFAFLMLATFKSKQLSNWWVILPTILLTLVVLFVFINIPALTGIKVSDSVTLDSKTSAVIGWRSFLHAPLWGSGPQTFTVDFSFSRPASFNNTDWWDFRFIKAANEWLGVLATVGVGAVVVLLYICFWFMKRGARALLAARETDEQWVLGVSVLAAWFVIFLASFLMPFNFILYFLWWLLLALGYRLITFGDKKEKSYSFKQPLISAGITAASTLVMVGVVLVIFFGGRIWLADYYFTRSQRDIVQNREFIGIEKNLNTAVKYNQHESKYYIALAQGYGTQAQLEASKTTPSSATLQQLTQQVIDVLNKAKAVDTNNPVVYEQEAALYDSLRNLVSNVDELSVKVYAKLVALEPTNPLAILNLGRSRLLQAQGMLAAAKDDQATAQAYQLVDQAMADFNKANTLKQNFFVADTNLALAYETKGETDKAISILEQLIKQYPQNTDLVSALASLYGEKQQYDTAISLYQQAIQLNADDSNAHWQLALIYEKQGKNDQALAELQIVQKANPDNSTVQQEIDKVNQLLKK